MVHTKMLMGINESNVTNVLIHIMFNAYKKTYNLKSTCVLSLLVETKFNSHLNLICILFFNYILFSFLVGMKGVGNKGKAKTPYG